MSAKTREDAKEIKGKGTWDYVELPQIVSASLSFRNSEWGARVLLSFRCERSDFPGDDTWLIPLFVANADAQEEKLGLLAETQEYWIGVARALERVFTQGGVDTSLHFGGVTARFNEGGDRASAGPI